MKLFFRPEKSDVDGSKEISERLKTLSPKINEKEIKEVEVKILAKYDELDRAIRIRDPEASYNLRFTIERLHAEKSDILARTWKERDRLTNELIELNRPAVEHSLEWIGKMLKELDTAKNIEEVSRTTNPATLAVSYKIRTNIAKVEDLQISLRAAMRKIKDLATSGCISEIEKIYLEAIESIPSGNIPCTEELQCSEDKFGELKESITTGMVKNEYDILATYHRYGGLI